MRVPTSLTRLVRKRREREVAEESEVQSRIQALRAAREVAGQDADLDEVKDLASWMLGEDDLGAPEVEDEDEAEEEPEEEPEEEEEEPEPPKKRASRARKKS
jgi:hypothetical protein